MYIALGPHEEVPLRQRVQRPARAHPRHVQGLIDILIIIITIIIIVMVINSFVINIVINAT